MTAIRFKVERISPVEIECAEQFLRVRLIADTLSDVGQAAHGIELDLVLPRDDELSVAKISDQARLKGAEVLRAVAEELEKGSI